MYICIYVYMYICIYVYMYIYMHTCIHACIHTYIHAYIHTYTHTCMHVWMNAPSIHPIIHPSMYKPTVSTAHIVLCCLKPSGTIPFFRRRFVASRPWKMQLMRHWTVKILQCLGDMFFSQPRKQEKGVVSTISTTFLCFLSFLSLFLWKWCQTRYKMKP